MLKKYIGAILLSLSIIFCIVRSIRTADGGDENAELIAAIKSKNIPEIRAFIKQGPNLDDTEKSKIRWLILDKISDQVIRKEILFDLAIDYHDQTELQEQIILYLEKERAKSTDIEDQKNRDEAIQYFRDSQGECGGLSVLWSYGKRVHEDAQISKTTKSVDDIVFYNMVFRMLILWDGKEEFNAKQKADIERFISNVVLYQKPAFMIFKEGNMQLDLAVTLEDTKRGRPLKVFDEKIACTESMLHSRLDEIIKLKTLIFIGTTKGASGHLMSIYQNSDKAICFYDPNAEKGELLIKNYDQLIEAIWHASNPSKFIPGFGGLDMVGRILRNITVEIFRFPKDPVYKYPIKHEFNISTKEFMDILVKYPLLSSLGLKNDQIKSFVNQLDINQIVQLLKDDTTSEKIKLMLVRSVFLKTWAVRSKKKSPMLARYLLANQKDLLDKLVQEGILTQKDLGNLEKKATQAVSEEVFELKDLAISLGSLANTR